MKRGFTVLEMAVAISLGGVVLLILSGAFQSLATFESRLRAEGSALARATNLVTEVSLLLGNSHRRGDAFAIVGSADSLHVTTWCESSLGYLEQCVAVLDLQHERSGGRLVVRSMTPDGQVLRSFQAPLDIPTSEFLYLRDAAFGGSWAASWFNAQPPIAIGLAVGSDTLLFPVGIGDDGE